jgi:6-phosphogluconate dehydrogenase
MDGGNSFYLDSIEREKRLWDRRRGEGIYFLDCGTSGGPQGARNGDCFMVGKEEGIKIAEPILKALAVNDDGYAYTGPPVQKLVKWFSYKGITYRAYGKRAQRTEKF